ncbi:putative c2h2 finger domain protein [Botrytis fragariae]|uniref:Putative c2h2 finger domain protein n=1 Tax=Botrytis fragariae TaxID=1964551 RepID=A0A8H6B0K4_9HELO|nr:putative c2h2 finger domain protein [Botrytis fragariae]KAF5877196.1 putative c2h2 finger domain protein [Botrytis fragariae]
MAAFGWSAGDLAAAIGVLWTVCESLRSAGGASDSYQSSLDFLQGLHGTLKRLRDFNAVTLTPDDLTFIKSQLNLVQKPVDKFTQKIISRYGSDLGKQPTGRAVRRLIIGTGKKIAWALLKEADTLKDEISLPLLSIQLCELHQIRLIACELRDQLPTEIANLIHSNISNTLPSLLEQHIGPLRSFTAAQSKVQDDREMAINTKLANIPRNLTRLQKELDDKVQKTIEDALHPLGEGLCGISESSKVTKDFLGQKIDQLPTRIFKDINALTRATEAQYSATLQSVQRVEKVLQDNTSDIKALKSSLIGNALSPDEEREERMLATNGSNPQQTLLEVQMHFKQVTLLLARLVRELLGQFWPFIAPILLHLQILKVHIVHAPSFLLSENIMFIDVFNRPRSLPYGIYRNWETFTRFLHINFEGIPGSRQIMEDNFWLTDNKGRTIDQTTWDSLVKPKAQISMAVILDSMAIGDHCPRCSTAIRIPGNTEELSVKCAGHDCGLEINIVTALETLTTQTSKRLAQRPKYPVSYEISRSVTYFEIKNTRDEARETYKELDTDPEETLIEESNINKYKNIHAEYAHLARAEQRKAPDKVVWDIVKQEDNRKTEAFELQKYFRRVLFVRQPTPKCQICSFSRFTYYDDISRHMVIEHTHIYVCIFHFAGCAAKFANKVQWKCHVACKHLNWVCGESACLSKQDSPMNHYWKQNYRIMRKSQMELFYRALRDRAKKALEVLGRHEKVPSVKLGCPMRDCEFEFEGKNCWDERMEHIAKHIKDNAIYVEEYPCGDLDVVHSDDQMFVEWALNENILGRTVRGKFWLQDTD